MFKRTFPIIGLLVLCAAAMAWQTNSAAPAAGRENDVYRIYSQMLTAFQPQTHFSVSPTTRPLNMMEPARCVTPPQSAEADFNEVLADFEARKNTPRTLRREFSLGVPYDLFTFSEASAWIGEHPDASPRANRTQYFFTLTDVYFSANGKLALTGLAAHCGSLCGTYLWKVFAKNLGGQWEERAWVNCFGAS